MALSTQASRRYADALADALSSGPAERLLQVAEELERLVASIGSSKELQHVLYSPAFSEGDQAATLNQVLTKSGVSAEANRFVKVLSQNGRLAELDAVAGDVRRIAEKRTGKVTALIETASALEAATQDHLRRALEKRLGRTIELDIKVDPSLLGGIRAQVGDFLLDGTIKSELERLRTQLTEG